MAWDFWRKKSEKSTLEQLVEAFDTLKQELKQLKDDFYSRPIAEEKKEEEEGVKAKISVHYFPDNELFVLIDGDKISSREVNDSMFEKLKFLKTNSDVLGIQKLLLGKNEEDEKVEQEKLEEEQEKEIEEVVEQAHYLVNTGDFEVRGDSVYAKGLDRSLPKLLVERITDAHLEGNMKLYSSLKLFWYWCCMNPVAAVADNLFNYLSKFKFKINKNGFFYAFRRVNVVTKKKDSVLIEFISQNYQIIRGRKKSTSAFYVLRDKGKQLHLVPVTKAESEEYADYEVLGILKDLYAGIADMEENRYTDDHTGTMDIRIGKAVKMNPDKCHWDTVDCGNGGLHWTLDLNYYGCGDTDIMILVNPAKVVGLGSNKGRAYEYLPLCVIDRYEISRMMEEGTFDYTEIENKDYEEQMKTIEEDVKASFTKETTNYGLVNRTNYEINRFSSEQIHDTVQKIVDISNRVQTIS